MENIGGHYSKTLRLWKESFLANFDSEIRPALKREHSGMTEEEIDVFMKKWEVSLIITYFCKAICPDNHSTVLLHVL